MVEFDLKTLLGGGPIDQARFINQARKAQKACLIDKVCLIDKSELKNGQKSVLG